MELRALKTELFKRHITQEDVAKRLGIAKSTVSRKLNGKIDFSDQEKLELVKFLDLKQKDNILEIFLPQIFIFVEKK